MKRKQYRIRHLAASHAGARLVATHFERRVEVWDIATGQQVSAFDTGLDLSLAFSFLPPAANGPIAAATGTAPASTPSTTAPPSSPTEPRRATRRSAGWGSTLCV
jgi:hypothetical protein